jgi:hypothetical protein
MARFMNRFLQKEVMKRQRVGRKSEASSASRFDLPRQRHTQLNPNSSVDNDENREYREKTIS